MSASVEQPDYILAPRFISIEPRSYICPVMGIPDMIRAGGLIVMIDITVDCSRDTRELWNNIYRAGLLFTGSRKSIYDAYRMA